MTIGETLKRARKKKNLNLDDVARSTKIAKMFLIALENDDISQLPTGIYIRHFLRTYAKFLKLDEDIITAEYYEQFNIKPHFVMQQEQTKVDDKQFRVQLRRLYLGFFIFIIIISLAMYFFREPISEYLKVRDVSLKKSDTSSQETRDTFSSDEPAASDSLLPAPSSLTEPERGQTVSDETRDEMTPSPKENLDPLQETVTTSMEEGIADPVEEDSGKEPEIILPPQYLPITDAGLAEITWTTEGPPPVRLEDMFAIEALGEVWVEVMIDGVEVTKRVLFAGEARYYRYGERNSINIGDTRKIAIQDGPRFEQQADTRLKTVLVEFGPGALLETFKRQVENRNSDNE